MPNISKYALLPFGLLIDSDEINWPLLAPDGSISAPSYSFASGTNDGLYAKNGGIYFAINGVDAFRLVPTASTIYDIATGDIELAVGAAGGSVRVAGNIKIQWDANGAFFWDELRMDTAQQIGWTSASGIEYASDVALRRASAGVLSLAVGSAFIGGVANTQDLGASSSRWRDTYTNGLLVGRAAKTTTYVVAAGDSLISADATSGAFTVNLPAAASHTGRVIYVKKTDSSANAVTVDGNASELVDGALTQQIFLQYECLQLICTGTAWEVV